ncbi:hypothetical protein KFK09_011704 [Dendrobium nobile]|uniref:DUF659 domain-containing protein n=1 Tax=Dendrobium nobile TaxID=94219 RepID=A0A8T3BDD9_DENNO|nr:hypothetical protein KFK09_011704 [Dendrobium nobile]
MERGVELLDSDRVEEAEEWEERGEFAMMSRSTLYVRLPVPVRQEDIGNVGEGIGDDEMAGHIVDMDKWDDLHEKVGWVVRIEGGTMRGIWQREMQQNLTEITKRKLLAQEDLSHTVDLFSDDPVEEERGSCSVIKSQTSDTHGKGIDKGKRKINEDDNFFAPRTKPGSQPSLKSVMASKDAVHRADLTVARLRVNLLRDAKDECKLLVDSYRRIWKETGCTLMADGWTDTRSRTLINFLVYCPRGASFLKSVDASDVVKGATTLCALFTNIVEWVGQENIVHFVTDNAANYKKAGSMPYISELAMKASTITIFVYNHAFILAWLRKREGWTEIVRPGITRFATTFITLRSVHDHKCDLQAFITRPLIRLLRIVDADEKPSLGYLYDGMLQSRKRSYNTLDYISIELIDFWILDDEPTPELHVEDLETEIYKDDAIPIDIEPNKTSNGQTPIFSDSQAAVTRPYSSLNFKPFFTIGNPLFSNRKPNTCCLKNGSSFSWEKITGDSRPVGLAILEAICSDNADEKLVLFGSQLKVQILSINQNSSSRTLLVESPHSPIEFGIKNKNSQLAMAVLSPWRRSPLASTIPSMDNSPRGLHLSASEIELSEDYTCVISHGPQQNKIDFLISDYFLTFCHTCQNKI